MAMRCSTGEPRAEGGEIKQRRCKHEVREQKVDERRVGGRERKRARGREVLISLDPFVD